MEELKKNIEKFLPYFDDLRHRLYRGAILFIVLFIGGLVFSRVILKKLIELIQVDGVTVAATSPFNFASVAMDVGFFVAIMVSAPYIIYSFYVFIVPALTRSEKIHLLKSIPLSILLFIAGFFYGFFILFYSLELLASINISLGIVNIWNISQFLSQIFVTAALLGLVFEFPLLLTLLLRLGIVTHQTLRNKRRVAYFLIFFMTALLPPTDGISLIAMLLPLVLLYELTILLNNKKYHVWTRT